MKIQAIVVSVLFGLMLSTSAQAEPFVRGTVQTVGIVYDQATDAAWAQQSSASMNYAAAESYCSALVMGGLDNWRMPTKDELATLPANTTGTVFSFNATPQWTSTPGVQYPTRRFARNSTSGAFSEQITDQYRLYTVRCVSTPEPLSVVVPTPGFYKFRMEQGFGIVTAKVNNATVLTVDTSYGGNEVVIGDLVAGEVVTITVNNKYASAIQEELLQEFPFVQWRHTYAAGAIELVLYDPLPESPVCAVSEEDLADVQNQLSLANETISYVEGQLATVRGQLSVAVSDLAQAQATIVVKDSRIAALEAQVAFLLAQDNNNGHGNDPGKIDISNPGKSAVKKAAAKAPVKAKK